MAKAILLLVTTGLSWVSVGAAVGYVERRGYSLALYQIFVCIVCVAFGLAHWAITPDSFFPRAECPVSTWVIVLAATLSCGVFNYLMVVMMGRAMRRGPNAIVWAVIQSGLIYPFLMGSIAFGVPIGPRRLCGIAMIVASVFMYSATSRKGRGETKDAAQDVPGRVPLREWLPAALLGMLFCGINQCGANLPSYLKGGTDFSGAFRTMAIYAGLLAAALAHVALNRLRGRTAARARGDEIRALALWALALGTLSFLSTKYLTFPGLDALERLGVGSMGDPVMVAACIAGFFPYGVIVLHERVSVGQALGAVLGIAGILIGCL